MTTGRADVVVVGGGPAGAATAWALARNGIDVLIVDRAHFPRPRPCAAVLGPATARLLHAMGALEAVERAGGGPVRGRAVRAPSGERFEGHFTSAYGFHGTAGRGLAIRRDRLDAILLDAARAHGARVLEGMMVRELVRDAQGRVSGVRVQETVDPASGASPATRTIEARIVVGADGLRSAVASRLGLARSTRWPRRVAFVSQRRGVVGMTDVSELLVERDGCCGLADLGGGETSVHVMVPARVAQRAHGDADRFFADWVEAHPALRERLRGSQGATPVRVVGPFASSARRAWAPGAALVGDAAAFFDPCGGEGIHAALRGGEILGPYLFEALRAPSAARADHALEAYDRSRDHEFGARRRLERLIALVIGTPALLNRLARSVRQRPEFADLLVSLAADDRAPTAVWRPELLWYLFAPPFLRRGSS